VEFPSIARQTHMCRHVLFVRLLLHHMYHVVGSDCQLFLYNCVPYRKYRTKLSKPPEYPLDIPCMSLIPMTTGMWVRNPPKRHLALVQICWDTHSDLLFHGVLFPFCTCHDRMTPLLAQSHQNTFTDWNFQHMTCEAELVVSSAIGASLEGGRKIDQVWPEE